MDSDKFIEKYIEIDTRLRVSKKITILSQQHKQFGRYLELIQHETVGLILHMCRHRVLFSGLISERVTRDSWRKYINLLQSENFIRQHAPSKETFEYMTKKYNEFMARNTNYYSLTNKGKDFLNIDLIKKYLNTEYEEVF